MGNDFQRKRRLVTASHYKEVFSRPDNKSGQRELMLLAKKNTLPTNRLGLAVAKKHVPTAVKRNLIKRLAREHFRHLSATASPTASHWDIVVLTRPGAATADRAALNAALKKQFTKLGLRTSDA